MRVATFGYVSLALEPTEPHEHYIYNQIRFPKCKPCISNEHILSKDLGRKMEPNLKIYTEKCYFS